MSYGTRGMGKLSAFFLLAVFGVAVWLGFKILPFYYYYYELVNQFESHIRVASTNTDKEIRDKLMYHIKKLEIPIDKPEDLVIQRINKRMIISLPYQEVLYVEWGEKTYDLHVFKFVAYAEGEF